MLRNTPIRPITLKKTLQWNAHMNNYTVYFNDKTETVSITKEEILNCMNLNKFEKFDNEKRVKYIAYFFLKVINSKLNLIKWEYFKSDTLSWFCKIANIPLPENIESILDNLVQTKKLLHSGDNYVFSSL